MANKIQVKRGLRANLPVLDLAEPAFTTDDKAFHVGSDDGNVELAKKSDVDNIVNGTTKVAKATDADTVNGKTVGVSVPANAKFTDTNTTYGVVTTSANGLMIAADKSKLNGIETGAQKNPTSLPANGGNADTVGGKTVWVGAEASKGTNANTIYFCY